MTTKRGFKHTKLFESVIVSDYLDAAGVSYRSTHGSSGPQLNVEVCPCCGNSNYKVYLNALNGLGNCFAGSCGESFNLYKFIKAHWGYTRHSDVINDVEKHVRSHRYVGAKPHALTDHAKRKTLPLKLPESFELPLYGRNLTYLTERGVSGRTAAQYGLRYCETGFFEYYDEHGHYRQQNFAKRVLIPILDINSELKSFQGRDTTGHSTRKYLFPPGYASTQVLLYNIHQAVGYSDVILCEGVFDVIAAKLAVPEVGVVGSFGKHLGITTDKREDQLTQLKRMKYAGMDRITIMWDGNRSPIETAIKQGLMLVRRGFKIRIAMLPHDCDPAEVPPSEVRHAFENAHTLTKGSAAKLLSHAFKRYKS